MILDSAPANDSRITLDDLFRRAAVRRPDAVALADPPNRAALTHGAPRTLTYAQADRAISAFAARLRDLGLQTDAAVAFQLPNTVESIIATLGILRAGLIAMPLPLLWREREIVTALGDAGVKMLVTVDRVGSENCGSIAVHAAASLFSVRHVGVFGPSAIDGIIPLDDIFDGGATCTLVARSGNPALHAAVTTWDVAPDGPYAATRNHQQFIAAGLAVFLEGQLANDAGLISTIPVCSLAGIATVLLPWLLSGGTLALAHPFDVAALAAQCAAPDGSIVVLPGPVVQHFAQFGSSSAIAVWRQPQQIPDATSAPSALHVMSFGESGLTVAKSATRMIPNGIIRVPQNSAAAIAVLETTRTIRGTLGLRGAMVPMPAGDAGPDAFVDTGYPCRLDPEGDTLTVTGPRPGIVNVGGYRFSRSQLDAFAEKLGADATLVALPDALLGQKLVGRVSHLVAHETLQQGHINPLIADAFRSRTAASLPERNRR